MLSLKVQATIASVNAAFKVNVKAVHAAVDNGTYNEFNLGNTYVVYGLSNRKMQVCEVFDTVRNEQDCKDILTHTKGYAVARIAEVANAYIASKNVVSVEDTLRAEIAELKAKALADKETINTLNKKVSRFEALIEKVSVSSLVNFVSSISEFTKESV